MGAVRITSKLIFSLIMTIIIVGCVFSVWQAQQEKARLTNELERRIGLLAENLRVTVEPLLTADDPASLQQAVDQCCQHERLAGIVIYDVWDHLIVASTNIKTEVAGNPRVLISNMQEDEKAPVEQGRFVSLGQEYLHAYSISLKSAQEDLNYVLTLLHDAAYIQEWVRHIWINTFWRVSIQVFLVAFVALSILYLNIMAPIKKTTEWMRQVRQGGAPSKLDPSGQRLLGPLAKEITQMAKSLELARLAAEEEARLRHSRESLWTPERLKEFVRGKLSGQPLFVVSNREPYMHVKKGKEIECIVPPGGMATALEPVLKACGGTWIAHGAGEADRETVDGQDRLRVPPEEPQYTLRRVWLSKEEEEGYYYGFSNEGLWPLCHIAHTRPTFRESNWTQYKAVNEKFAAITLQEIKSIQAPCVLVQDYHFALLPALIKQRRPDARVAIFWHIPWPNPESFGICPWQKEVLQGMLGADLIGFHTQFHCNNFIATVDRFLESRIDYEHFTVNREGRTTWIKPFPISIAFLGSSDAALMASRQWPDKKELLKPYGLQAELIGVGVDRMDYTKGIVERFLAIERFLDLWPEYVGRFTFVELGAPSRSLIPKYQEFEAEVEREVTRINGRFKAKNWKPILFLKKHHSHKDIQPFYGRADLCLVTSLHDGMNLVAKEFVVAREDERGVLILSQFTGAARELRDALIINPYDIGKTAEAIHQALDMAPDEITQRMQHLREVLRERNIYRWAADLVGGLTQLRLEQTV